jgi:hypothetical protein
MVTVTPSPGVTTVVDNAICGWAERSRRRQGWQVNNDDA